MSGGSADGGGDAEDGDWESGGEREGCGEIEVAIGVSEDEGYESEEEVEGLFLWCKEMWGRQRNDSERLHIKNKEELA